ncbi:HlyD family efflux transporter periplasmic adaptor subunit [Patescibacteria group bacterium]|nr:HlyD family efflux transporter periplasmic adaptor subunit [Patescibacteria group bacterium]
MLARLRSFLRAHIFLSTVLGLVLLWGGYRLYSAATATPTQTQYITAPVQKGTLITSVSGSGQVAVANQLDVKPQVSGTILSVNVQPGQTIHTGDVIMTIDNTSALKTVRDAQLNLSNAELNLEKLLGPGNPSVPLVTATAQNTLAQDYDTGFNDVANTFLDLPTIMTGLQNILYGSDRTLGGGNQLNIDYFTSVSERYDPTTADVYRTDTAAKYQEARSEYTKAFNDYKAASRFSASTTIDALITETYATTKTIADAVKSSTNLIQLYEDNLTNVNLQPQALADTYLSNLNSYTGLTNSHVSSLLGITNSIQSDKDAITNAGISIQAQELSLQQSKNALADAQSNLAYYTVTAPLSGIVAKVDVIPGDTASSGSAAATIITNQKLADISLNEVDAAKVALGQQVTLTFDAIPDLTIAGKVTQIDALGTVSQGVVTYNIEIAFDTQDTRVKASMSVNASIVTAVKQNVLLVPNSAIKTSGTQTYVDVLDAATAQPGASPAPVQTPIQTGLSNDASTEVVSGLSEGQNVVTRTVTGAAAASATAAPSLLSSIGGRFAGRGPGG